MNSKNFNENIVIEDQASLKQMILKMIEWCQYLLSKWLSIIIVSVVGGIIGFTYAYFKTPQFIAATTFVLEDGDRGGGLGQYAGLASMAGIDVSGGGGIFQGDNILELYKSRSMIQSALLTEIEVNGKKQLLVDRYIDINKLRKKWENKPDIKSIQFNVSVKNRVLGAASFSRIQDSVLGTIVDDVNKRYLSVGKPDKKLNIIKAEVRSEDESFSKLFNEQIVKNVNDFYVLTKTKKSLNNVVILQQKTDSVRAVMNGAIYSAAAVVDATPNLNPTRQVQRVAPVQRAQFSAEANKTVLAELVKNLELSKMSLRKETPLIQVIDTPVFPLKKEKLGFIKASIVGAFLFGFLFALYLLLKRIILGIMIDNGSTYE